MPFPTAVGAICNIYTVKRMRTALNQVVGVVVVYRTRVLAVTGQLTGSLKLFSFFHLVSSFRTKFSLD